MRELAALLNILCRAVIFFPFALALYCLVIVYLVAPFICIFDAIFLSPWYWGGLAAWLLSFHLLRKPLQIYFGWGGTAKGDHAGWL